MALLLVISVAAIVWRIAFNIGNQRLFFKTFRKSFDRFIVKAAYYRSLYKTNLAVGGKYFLCAAIVKEVVEIAIQGTALFGSGAEDDALLLITITCLFVANCASVPFAYIKRWPSAIVIVDAFFDIAFAIVNTVRFIKRKKSLSMLDMLSILFPLLSISQLLGDYARYQISRKTMLLRRRQDQMKREL